jgi:dihydrofolate synthase/folylpolyglutamate synthase
VRWPGRLEIARRAPLTLLDGAHTPESMAELVRALGQHFRYRRLAVVFACLDDKDAEALLRIVSPYAARFVLTASQHPRSRDPHELLSVARSLDIPAYLESSSARALDRALGEAGPDDAVCVTGSLSLVGEARSHLGLAPE